MLGRIGRRVGPAAWPVAPASVVGGACAAVLLAALSMWGGAAQPSLLLSLGIALMSGSLAAFALITWWLFLSPMPAARAGPFTAASPALVQWVAILVALGGFGTQVAAVWDDAWHRLFGGFGDDFLWPPHMLIYVSLGFIMVSGIG